MIKLELTEAEAKALAVLASEGAEGILTDTEVTKGYLGGKRGAQAAARALAKLEAARRKRE